MTKFSWGKGRQKEESRKESPAANPPDGATAVNELVNGINKMMAELAAALSSIRDAAAGPEPAGDADGRQEDDRRARPAEDDGRNGREGGQPPPYRTYTEDKPVRRLLTNY